MSAKCREITSFIEEFAPLHLAESWDNPGLILGSYDQEIRRVMVCLDVTSKVVDECVKNKIDLIISHHPFIFKGLKRINNDDSKGKAIYNLIKNNISVYSAHTNLDFTFGGINEQLAELLCLRDIKNLKKYKAEKLYKIVVFVPEDSVETVREAMCNAGAGWIGNYSDCSFMTKGIGTFKPLSNTNPYIGTRGHLENVGEYRLETIVPEKNLNSVISSMIKAHPYEEVAYDVYGLEVEGRQYGMGKVGVLGEPETLESFVALVKAKLNIPSLRLIGYTNREIKKVGVFCGSFDEDWSAALKHDVDILVTSDIKYHAAMDAVEMELCVIDAGHFNTERIIIPKLVDILSKRFVGLEFFSNNVEYDPFKTY